MNEEPKVAEVAPWRRPGFWNKFAAITLGYGALTILSEMEYQRRFGGLEYLSRLDAVGLTTLIVISGSLGTHALRSRGFARDEWRLLRQVMLAMTGALTVVSSCIGQLNLTWICALTFWVHAVMPRFMKD